VLAHCPGGERIVNSTEEQNWEKSFQTRPRLSKEEAHRVVVLRSRLTGLRYLSSEYQLRRASLSGTKSERTAWQSVWALSAFVEHARRFPRQGELYPYLHGILDESKTLEDLDLPPMDLYPSDAANDAQKSILEDLIGANLLLSQEVLLLSQNFQKSLRNLEACANALDPSMTTFVDVQKVRTFVREAEAIRKANSQT